MEDTKSQATPQQEGAVIIPTNAQCFGPDSDIVRVYWDTGFAGLATAFPARARGLAAVVNAHEPLVKAITECQAFLARWIVPHSDIDDVDTLTALTEILDDRELVKLLAEGRS